MTPRVSVTVLPLDAATERRLIERLKDTGDSQARPAISDLGLGRSREAVAPLVRRFEVDRSTRAMVVSALANIGGTEGVGQLAQVIDRLPHAERTDASFMVLRVGIPSTLEALVLQSRACEALPILVYVLRHPRSDASNALAYLARLPDAPREILDRAEIHPSWRVRIAAAVAVAETDLPRGAHLLVRELNNRYVAACQEAAERLRELVETQHSFSCYSPPERARAAEFWTDAVTAAPR